MSIRLRNILVGVAAAVLMFIPTYIAIINYSVLGSWQNSLTGDATTLRVTDENGATVFSGEAGDPANSDLAHALAALLKQGDPVREAPMMETIDLYTITATMPEKERSYLCYYGATEENSYLVDVDANVCYALPSETLRGFMQGFFYGETAQTLSVPTLTTAGNAVTPTYISWYHQNAQGNYTQIMNLPTAAEEKTYPVNKNISLQFSREPDLATVKVYNGSTLIYDGDYADFEGLSYVDSVSLTVQVQAKWDQTTDGVCYGEASYRFHVSYSATPTFFMSADSATVGDYLVAGVLNASPQDTITFESTPDLGFVPTFYEDGDYMRALIPLHPELAGGTYTITIGARETSQTFRVTLEERSKLSPRTYDAGAALIAQARNDAALAEYQQLLNTVGAMPSATKYFSGPFIDYRDTSASVGAILLLGYGHTRTLATTGDEYRMDGVDFFVYAGTDIPALNNGMVIAAGNNAYLGNYVVIDHGFGLRSWYSHLSEVSVSVGDTVKTAQAVGKSGSTGFTTGTGVYLMCTIGNVPISPYTLWSDGVVY